DPADRDRCPRSARHGVPERGVARRLERRAHWSRRVRQRHLRAPLSARRHHLRRLERGAEKYHRQGRAPALTPWGRTMAIFSAEERQLLHDSVNAFLRENYPFERWKKLARGPEMDGFGRTEWAKYAELGWLGVALPEWASGAGGGMTELGIVMAAAGRHMVLEPLVGTIVLGARAIEGAGTQAQRRAR